MDTSVALIYTVNEVEKKFSLQYYMPQSKSMYSVSVALDSFSCNSFRTRTVETSTNKIDEYRTLYVND